ncbi:MAG TPA: alkaline phosphatase family protein [Candidatus Binataceae bacterium]|nr:alkaline phosphatase family protein [Candidatus Binataceae bacterium]
MKYRTIIAAMGLFLSAAIGFITGEARADGDLNKVNHVVFIMMENHSFDNYYGALPYAPGSPYHLCSGSGWQADHQCVDGLTCTVDSGGNYSCANSNPDELGNSIHSFHDPRLCTGTDLDHGWVGSHYEANWSSPADTLFSSPNNGFVLQNDVSFPSAQPTDHDTMGFYTQADLPFYYGLAETFAIDDGYHAAVIGPTFPNRSYLMASTSFGHTTTSETTPPYPAGYRPVTGTIYDLLEKFNVSWINYYSDIPTSFDARPALSEHVVPISGPGESFTSDAAAGSLPAVSYVDPNFGELVSAEENDEHPPSDIRAGQYFVAQIVSEIRNSPNWKDTVIFITYDEHGGSYDHVSPPLAQQQGARNPDGIYPGQCADLSSPPASTNPGGGANCADSANDALAFCPSFTPSGPYPSSCPSFNQYGFRVPLTVVSPFAKQHYVSHTLGDHAAISAFIEKRFMTKSGAAKIHPALTLRDGDANPLEDMFDFTNAPSMNASLPALPPPPSKSDGGC